MSKKTEIVPQPEIHDTFFRQLMSDPVVAADFVQNYLPPDVVALLDLTQIRAEKDTFVDTRLRKHFSDILFSVPMKEGVLPKSVKSVEDKARPSKKGKKHKQEPSEQNDKIYIYLLFEHKSQPDKGVRLQLLRYMTRIWEKEWKRRHRLVAIVPMVFYHGLEKWNYSKEFAELFTDVPSALKPYTPHFQHLLTDLSTFSDEQIRGEIWLQVNLLILKHIYEENLGRQLPKILGLMQALAEKDSVMEMLQTILLYIAEANDKVTPEEFEQGIRAASKTQGRQVMATLAQQWRDEGKREALATLTQQWREEVKKEALETLAPQWKEETRLELQRQNILHILQLRFSLPDEQKTYYAQQLLRIHDFQALSQLLEHLFIVPTLSQFAESFIRYFPKLDEKGKR